MGEGRWEEVLCKVIKLYNLCYANNLRRNSKMSICLNGKLYSYTQKKRQIM